MQPLIAILNCNTCGSCGGTLMDVEVVDGDACHFGRGAAPTTVPFLRLCSNARNFHPHPISRLSQILYANPDRCTNKMGFQIITSNINERNVQWLAPQFRSPPSVTTCLGLKVRPLIATRTCNPKLQLGIAMPERNPLMPPLL